VSGAHPIGCTGLGVDWAQSRAYRTAVRDR
jgi:hypothetical protein